MPSEPLSIAMLAPCPFPTPQGTQVMIRHLASALARAGHDVHLITYGYGEPGATTDADLPFHVHRTAKVDAGLRSGPSLLKPAADAALLFTAARVIKANRCQLVHAHHVEGLGLGALLKLQTGLPLVYHAHTAMGPELPTYFKKQFAQAFASLVGDVIDRTLPRAADAVVVFDADHKALHEVYGVESSRLHVIPPGLDPGELGDVDADFVARLRGDFGAGPWLLYAGNADGYQNLELLWRTMALLKARGSKARLLVASHHDPKLFASGIETAGISDRVLVYRHENLEELKALHELADIGVCPRNLWSGAPIKVLNYLAAGLPVVACRAAARHILPTGAGALVDDTPEAFADAVQSLLVRRKRGQDAKQAFERFRIDAHLPLYEEVYGRALASRRQAPLEETA
jgi:glycosyltransferase involved in cell wall biosynthesis